MSTPELAVTILLATAGGYILGGLTTLVLFERAMKEMKRWWR